MKHSSLFSQTTGTIEEHHPANGRKQELSSHYSLSINNGRILCLVDPSRWVFSIELRKIHLRKLSLYSPNSSSISPFWSVITASKVFSIIAIPASWAFFAVAVVSSWVSLVVHPFNSSSRLSYYVGKSLKGLYILLISINSVANSSP